MTVEKVLEEHGVNLQWIKISDLAPQFVRLAETIIALRAELHKDVEDTTLVTSDVDVTKFTSEDGRSAMVLTYNGISGKAYYGGSLYHGHIETIYGSYPFYGSSEDIVRAFKETVLNYLSNESVGEP